MSSFPDTYSINQAGDLIKLSPSEWDQDPRGIIWMWEPPSRGSAYCISADPTFGITGWNRYDRTREDRKTDNGAIEVIRIGRDGAPDVQVAEYAAPIDPTELGDVINILGRLYAGIDDDQCKCILEVFPGPGGLTLQRLLDRGYLNLFRWEYYADGPATETKSWGWHASQKTNRDLWIKASRHINLRQAIVRSPFLAEEYADCRMNPDKQWAENVNGHDDRVRAFNLGIWLANGFSLSVERTSEPVQQQKDVNLAFTDASMEDIWAQWGRTIDKMGA